jgi:hypothetical protein
MAAKKTLFSLYSFPGFQAQLELKEVTTDPEVFPFFLWS